MKRKSIYCAAAVAAALALGAMTGCGGQAASQASTSSGSASAAASAAASASEAAPESASASGEAEKSQDEIIAELKESLANVPAYKSVTITEKAITWPNNGAEGAEDQSGASAASDEAPSSKGVESDGTDAADDTAESTTLYKFDEGGDTPKTSATFEMAGIKLQYYTDGDAAVCVTDGPVYSGAVEQFDLDYAAGADAYLKDTIGNLDSLVDCISSVTQDEINGVTGYELILDPEKYMESDEILKLMADSGDPVQDAYVTIGFDKDGRIVWMTKTTVFSKVTSSVLLDLADFDNTVIDPMPEATKTYEEMEADMQAKVDAFDDELDLASKAEGETGSADAPEAK